MSVILSLAQVIISSSNIVNPQQAKDVNSTEYSIAGIGNTAQARNRLKDSKISLLKNGHYRRDSSSSPKSELAIIH